MKLKETFNKEIDRPIEGVIKADDETSLHIELDEYILTNEIIKGIEAFLNSYNDHQNANGAWISGFFGSGKSHLLKILAILLENRNLNDQQALDLFLPKCTENRFLQAEIQKAVAHPAKSVLFNIDQKADVIAKTEIDALLAVFVKVFDQMCGYYGKQGYIAQFERDLDSREIYEQFKMEYETISGKSWEKGREQSILEANNIDKTYARITGVESLSEGIMDKYRAEYRVSIDDFAEQVNAYIELQPKNFRLNFFVDEVGQFIANNVKLMTNLQTIAESLATKCKGNAWIIVTAQDDMDMVIGEMEKKEANDFSKIQDRFANRLKLTSADVAEVIQKRLLMKTQTSSNLLAKLFVKHSNNFRTLFDFTDGSKSYRNFKDQEHFTNSYPFVPYQFNLFQSSIKGLSIHNAFEGRHSSVGERSMLSVCQQVAINVGENDIGYLTTFDLWFEGIRSSLKANIQSAILQAERLLDSNIAIKLLKCLFLVKYVQEFQPTIRNLCVLLIEDLNQDIAELQINIEGGLNILEQQTYIRRSNNRYEYLTDEEKDIEEEIKNTDLEQNEISNEFEKLIFQQVIKETRLKYEKNGQDYPFSKKLDDRLFGRSHELGINIITPNHEHATNESTLKMRSATSAEDLFVVLPASSSLLADLYVYKRTEKYLRQNFSSIQEDTTRQILTQKSSSNHERYNELLKLIEDSIGKSKLFVDGRNIESNISEPKVRIVYGFQHLVASTYCNLSMLNGVGYNERDISKLLEQPDSGLIVVDDSELNEPAQEVLSTIQNNKQKGLRTTLKSLLEMYERKPYGWPYAAVVYTVASLYAYGKIEIRIDSNLLEDIHEIETAILNTRKHKNILLLPQTEFTASQIRTLKDFFQDFFNELPNSNDAKTLARETRSRINEMHGKLSDYAKKQSKYPFLSALSPVLDKIGGMVEKPEPWYLEELSQKKVQLLSMKEEVIDPIQNFMDGSQKGHFDDAKKFFEENSSNFEYIEGNLHHELTKYLSSPNCHKGTGIPEIKTLVKSLKANIESQIQVEVNKACQIVKERRDQIVKLSEFNKSNDGLKNEILDRISKAIDDIENQSIIAVIRDKQRTFSEVEFSNLLSKLTKSTGTKDQTVIDEEQSELQQYLSISSINVPFDQIWLGSESDVDRYLDSLRLVLVEQINKKKRIHV